MMEGVDYGQLLRATKTGQELEGLLKEVEAVVDDARAEAAYEASKARVYFLLFYAQQIVFLSMLAVKYLIIGG